MGSLCNSQEQKSGATQTISPLLEPSHKQTCGLTQGNSLWTSSHQSKISLKDQHRLPKFSQGYVLSSATQSPTHSSRPPSSLVHKTPKSGRTLGILSMPISSSCSAGYSHKTSLAEETTLSRTIFLRKRRPKDAQKKKTKEGQILPERFGSSELLHCYSPSLSKNTPLNKTEK